MPRLSNYRPEKGHDYKFIDRMVAETLVIGGTDLYVHKYIGTPDAAGQVNVTNIEDLLFLENRDRTYDPDIIRIRGHYNVTNHDFDLSQFGLFLNNDIVFIVVHFNTMIELLGRKFMVGDVIELPHLLDDFPLDEALRFSVKRYYQITDSNWASEGYSLTWYSHLWRIKCEPLTDSQEFSQILEQPADTDNYLGTYESTKTYPPGYVVTYDGVNYKSITEVPVDIPPGTTPPNSTYWQVDEGTAIKDINGRYQKNIKVNDALLEEARQNVPLSGYDVNNLYVVPTYDAVGTPGSTATIGNDGVHHPAPPKELKIGVGAPTLSGTVAFIRNPQYKNSSPVIRVSREQVSNMWDMTVDDNTALDKFVQMSLQSVKLANITTDSGSGSVDVDWSIVAQIASPIIGPYGTADNTYSTGDQHVSVLITANTTPAQTNIIRTISNLDSISSGLLIRATVTNPNGSKSAAFPSATTITAIDVTNKTITTNFGAMVNIPAGTTLQVAYNFTGVVNSDMDYRADCDPRFYYISRSSPRGFGYLVGYLTGDGNAPNGLPTGSGIAFPSNPNLGDYFLRIDYLPQVLFRWDGNMWVRISQNVRTPLYLQDGDQSQRASFVNNSNVTQLTDGTTTTQKQALSTVLRIQPD